MRRFSFWFAKARGGSCRKRLLKCDCSECSFTQIDEVDMGEINGSIDDRMRMYSKQDV